ncbi:hypothetical protein ACFL1H_08010, partial [Nanoarchaeota archaeon]
SLDKTNINNIIIRYNTGDKIINISNFLNEGVNINLIYFDNNNVDIPYDNMGGNFTQANNIIFQNNRSNSKEFNYKNFLVRCDNLFLIDDLLCMVELSKHTRFQDIYMIETEEHFDSLENIKLRPERYGEIMKQDEFEGIAVEGKKAFKVYKNLLKEKNLLPIIELTKDPDKCTGEVFVNKLIKLSEEINNGS